METVSLLLSILLGIYVCQSSSYFFLSDFEKLDYDTTPIDRSHRRVRRSVSNSDRFKVVRVDFKSHGREFRLALTPDKSSFSPNHEAYINDEVSKTVDLSFLYHGRDLNDPGSYVFGSIKDGIFDGHIYGSNVYHVEKVSRYIYHLPLNNGSSSRHHSIIYRDDQIDYSKIRIKRELKSHGCGMHGSVHNWMRRVQNSALIDRTARSAASKTFDDVSWSRRKFDSEKPWTKYMEQSQHYAHYENDRVNRNVRQAIPQKDPKTGFYSGRTCTLYMQADQKLWEYVYNHEGQRNNDRTRDEIFALFNNHVKAVNVIYESSDFSGVRGINFNVQRTTIWNTSSCPNSDLEDPKKNPFCDENVDVSNYLNLNSMRNQSDFCLAYALTYRDFVGGTLGLAWVASSAPDGSAFSASSGGICELYKWYSEGSRRIKRSLNTGVITLVNYHNRVPTKVSQLTLAHEIGHNFGSQHDFPSYCQPGLPDGNYIMFSSATSGDKPNNAKFSPCSVANISAVLKEVLQQPPNVDVPGAKRNCLIDALTSFCGNGVVEEDEECDCGFDEEECAERQDTCCYPRTTDRKRNPMGCKRKSGAKCSPTEGPCCSRDCTFVTFDSLTTCRQASDCSKTSQCDGLRASCPAPSPRPDRTLCQENTKICHAGSCNKSICELIGMDECFITTGTPEDQCQLSCRKRNDIQGNCLASTNIAALKPYFLTNTTSSDRSRAGIILRPGSPCNDYKGYCDIFQKCRSVDSNGPLSRLKNLLFNSQTLKTVSEWVQVYWWAVVLMGLVLVCLMALFIKCCAVHTPSTNPRKPPAQSIYETLRHPTTLLRHQGRRQHSGDLHHHRHRHHHRRRSHSSQNANVAASANRPSSTDPVAVLPSGFTAVPNDDRRQRRRSSTPAVALQSPPAAIVHIEPPPPYSERPGGAVPPPTSAPPPALVVTAAATNAVGPPRGHRKRRRLQQQDNQRGGGAK